MFNLLLGSTGTGSFPGLPSGGSSSTSPFPGLPSGGFGGSTGTGSTPSLPSGGFGGVGGTGSSGLGGAGGIFTPLQFNGLAERQSAGASSTANGASGACLPVTVLYARGTSEPGNIGSSVGPSLMSDLNTLLPNKVAFQGVNYDATVEGDEQLGKPGGTIATSQANGIISACPSTKLFISGYSEGAMVAHNAVAGLSTANKAKVTVSHSRPSYPFSSNILTLFTGCPCLRRSIRRPNHQRLPRVTSQDLLRSG